jgi:hypothetical protein
MALPKLADSLAQSVRYLEQLQQPQHQLRQPLLLHLPQNLLHLLL